MFDRNAMMEERNYWRDPRVAAAMYRGVWKISQQGNGEAVVELDEEWLMSMYEEEVGRRIDLLVEQKDKSTDKLRMLSMLLKWCSDRIKAEEDFIRNDGRGDDSYRIFCATKKLVEVEDRWHIQTLYSQEWQALCDKVEKEFTPRDCFSPLGIDEAFCINVHTEFELCPMCEGSGVVANPSIDAGGLSRDDFAEDPDFADDYFSGRFDTRCPTCNGLRVVAVPKFPPRIAHLIDEHDKGEAEYIREVCAERSMGA